MTMYVSDPLCIGKALEPKTLNDQRRLLEALEALTAGWPNMRFATDTESGETHLWATDELTLDVLVDRLRREFGVAMNCHAASIAYRETVRHEATLIYAHTQRMQGQTLRAAVGLRVAPAPEHDGMVTIAGPDLGALVERRLRSIEAGIRSVSDAGPIAGFPVMGVGVSILSVAGDEDAPDLYYEIAARTCAKEALRAARPVLFEPVMRLAALVPARFAGKVEADLGGRRATGIARHNGGNGVAVLALLPLASALGYGDVLRSLTEGLGEVAMIYDHHAPVPQPGDGPDDLTPVAMALPA